MFQKNENESFFKKMKMKIAHFIRTKANPDESNYYLYL